MDVAPSLGFLDKYACERNAATQAETRPREPMSRITKGAEKYGPLHRESAPSGPNHITYEIRSADFQRRMHIIELATTLMVILALSLPITLFYPH